MNRRKPVTILLTALLLNIVINLGVNADLMVTEVDYQILSEKMEELEKENTTLEKEIAKLTSVTRIAQLAEELKLESGNQQVVRIIGDSFAKRR